MIPERYEKNDFIQKDKENHSVGEVLREIGTSAKGLIQSEIDLARAEIKESTNSLGKHAAQAAAFGALLAISILPFLAFCVIGIGNLLDGRYGLSSFLVALVCAAIGGTMTYRAYHRMKNMDLTLPHTREALRQEAATVSNKVQDIKQTTSENIQDIRDTTKRRTS